jgi:site-specific DNA recombinase
LLKGLVKCGVCGVGTNCHKMRGRNGTWHRYYRCRNHDLIRAGGESRCCPERNIRADALDTFVFDHIRAAITRPGPLLAGEQAVTLHTPIPDDELLAAELAQLDSKIDAADTERRRLIDLYRAGSSNSPNCSIAPPKSPPTEKSCSTSEPASPTNEPASPAITSSANACTTSPPAVTPSSTPSTTPPKQQLLRLLIEDVRVTGWHVQIRLLIALDTTPPDRPTDTPPPPHPSEPPTCMRSAGLKASRSSVSSWRRPV